MMMKPTVIMMMKPSSYMMMKSSVIMMMKPTVIMMMKPTLMVMMKPSNVVLESNTTRVPGGMTKTLDLISMNHLDIDRFTESLESTLISLLDGLSDSQPFTFRIFTVLRYHPLENDDISMGVFRNNGIMDLTTSYRLEDKSCDLSVVVSTVGKEVLKSVENMDGDRKVSLFKLKLRYTVHTITDTENI